MIAVSDQIKVSTSLPVTRVSGEFEYRKKCWTKQFVEVLLDSVKRLYRSFDSALQRYVIERIEAF